MESLVRALHSANDILTRDRDKGNVFPTLWQKTGNNVGRMSLDGYKGKECADVRIILIKHSVFLTFPNP